MTEKAPGPAVSRPQKRQKVFRTIKDRLLSYLALRDHSEKELRQKLSKNYTANEILNVLQWAREHELIPFDSTSQKKLAEKFASSYSRKKKSQGWINKKLGSLGLPKVKIEEEEELQKISRLLDKKWNLEELSDFKARSKCIRSLVGQGFSLAMARKAVHEKLRSS